MVEGMLGIGAVNIAEILRDRLVEDDAADGGDDRLLNLYAVNGLGDSQADRRMQADNALVIGHDGLGGVAVHEGGLIGRGCGALLLSLDVRLIQLIAVDDRAGLEAGIARVIDYHALCALLGGAYTDHGQIIGAEDHVLSRNGDRVAVLRTQEVIRGEHEYTCLGLSLGGQRQVDSHLVAVEVSIVSGADQRVQTQRAALNEDRLESLNAETVQSRRTVEEDGVFLDNVLKGVPHLGALLVDHLLCGLDVVGNAILDQLLHNEGTEELDSHFLRNAALVYLEVGADNDNGTAGIVDTLAEQVLTEASLLALEHIAQGLERAGVCAGDGSAAAAVVYQSVDRFLKHALLIAHDDVRRVELLESLQAVVAVDDAAVQIVQVGGREAAAVELDHRADLGRDDRQNVDYHPLGAIAARTECLDDLETLDELGLLLAAGGLELLTQLLCELVAVDLGEQLLDGFCADTGLKIVLILFAHVAVLTLGEDLAALKRSEAGVDNYIVCKVQDLLEHSRGKVEHKTHAAGYALEVPDMGDRGGKVDMTHTLTPDLALGDLDAAAVADLALVADLLILTAVALPVLGRSEDAFAEQTVAFGLEGTVVDGLRLLDLAVGPAADHIRGGNAYLYRVKRCVAHYISSSLL